MRHWAAYVIFTVEPPRSEGDCAFRDNFGDEDDAAADFTVHGATHIKAQIDFFEFGVKRNRNGAKELCAAEAEADEADVCVPSERIEFRARWCEFLQDRGIDF